MDKKKPVQTKEEKDMTVEFKADRVIADRIFYSNFEIFMMTRGHW